MKKIFSIIAVAMACLMASCDKIEPNDMGEYTIYAGMVFDWQAGEGVPDHTQRALIEKYTGVRCVNCPDGDARIAELLNDSKYDHKLYAVAVHGCTSAFGTPINGFDPRCEDAITWMTDLMGADHSLPAAMVMRHTDDIFVPSSVRPASRVDAVLASPASVAIAVGSELMGQTYQITVDIEHLTTTNSALDITVFLMEDSIIGPQQSTSGRIDEYVHNHVLRDVLTDVWGNTLPTDGKQGTTLRGVARYQMPDDCPYDVRHCKVVAFVSDKATKRILNVAECDLNEE